MISSTVSKASQGRTAGMIDTVGSSRSCYVWWLLTPTPMVFQFNVPFLVCSWYSSHLASVSWKLSLRSSRSQILMHSWSNMIFTQTMAEQYVGTSSTKTTLAIGVCGISCTLRSWYHGSSYSWQATALQVCVILCPSATEPTTHHSSRLPQLIPLGKNTGSAGHFHILRLSLCT